MTFPTDYFTLVCRLHVLARLPNTHIAAVVYDPEIKTRGGSKIAYFCPKYLMFQVQECAKRVAKTAVDYLHP